MSESTSNNRLAALVTGSGTRLGRQFALHLASKGYDIALHCNRSKEPAVEVAKEIQALGVECEIFQANFADRFDAASFVSRIVQRFPRFAFVINSASVYDGVSTEDTDRDLLELQFQVNCFAPYLITKYFAKHVQGSASVAQGQVINIIDNKVAYNQYHYSAYLLSKKSLADFTKIAAMEYAPSLRINGIAPGVVLPMDSRTSDYIQWRIEGIPLHKKGNPNHLLQALEYLRSNDFVCGQILVVEGGESENKIGRNAVNYSPESS
ncbi:MAG: SDR family NAD(P)-dependent oxidoreductase [Myxococcota bacterium]|nr:SDR family NAD(P)-dependent oxidoreductase [Myxococcota bacterium]